MTATTADVPAPKSGLMGRLMRLVAMVLAAVLLVGAGFGGGWIYFDKPMSPADDLLRLIDQPADPAAATATDDPAALPRTPRPQPDGGFVTSYHTLPDPLTSNLRDSRRFLQVTITVSTDYDAKVLERVKTHEPAIRAEALMVMADFSEEDLKTREGRDRLAAQLRDAINARLETMEGFGGIKDVIFPAFVMQ